MSEWEADRTVAEVATRNDELPDGWVTVKLVEVAAAKLGKMLDNAKNVGKLTPYLRNINVRWFDLDLNDLLEIRVRDDERDRFSIRDGDVLICEGGEPGRAAVWRGGDTNLVFQKAIHRVRLTESILPEWLVYRLKCDADSPRLERYFTGSTIKHLTGKSLKDYLFPLAPLAEQKRIVAQVTSLLARVNAARERLANVPAILRRFRQSVLAAACSGQLTAEWRQEHPDVEPVNVVVGRIKQSHEEQPMRRSNAAAPSEGVHDVVESHLPATWALVPLHVLCKPGRPITYGILKPGPDQPDGVPYVRVADFPQGTIILESVRRTSPQIANEYRRSTLQPGDVLLSIRGTVGRVCHVPVELDGANITQDTARVSVHEEVYAHYIEHYLRCPSVQNRLERAMKGVAVRGVNIGDVRPLQVALPPLLELSLGALIRPALGAL